MKCKEIKIGQLKFANPVFGASGCVGHGYELQDYTISAELVHCP